MSYISILDNIDDHVEYSEYSECTVSATVIFMLIYGSRSKAHARL